MLTAGWSLALVLVCCWAQASLGFQFKTEPDSAVVVLAQGVWLDCEADTSGPVSYSWTVNNKALPVSENQVIYSNGTLHIRRLTYDDEGVYLCFASYQGSTIQSKPAVLEFAYINTVFTVNPLSQTVMLGVRVELKCRIPSLPIATVTWFLDGEPVTAGVIYTSDDGESTLTMSPALYPQAGTYKCLGTNPLTGVYRYSLEGTLTIQGQPVILDSLQSQYVPLGYTATFTCRYHGNPTPTISWLIHETDDLGQVTSTAVVNSTKYQAYNNGTFHIYNVTSADASSYTCHVENMFGAMSESATLHVTGPATHPEIALAPTNTTVLLGDAATFICNCSGNPGPAMTWKKTDSQLTQSSKYEIHSDGILIIMQTQSNDMDWYTCECENPEGTVSQSAYLDVQEPPSIVIPPQDSVILQGGQVRLSCVTEGNPKPIVTWTTPSFGILTSSVDGYTVGSDGSLTILSATSGDYGIYTCTASNIRGSVHVSATVTIEVPPKFVTNPTSQGVKEGEKAYFHCQALGLPKPTYEWSKDGEGVISSTTERQIYLNNTLVIHRVTPNDVGLYRCVAANKYGQITSVATLTVTVPPFFTTRPSNTSVKVGGTVTLECVANGNPVPTQKWTKDGRYLYLDDNMEVLPDGSRLSIVGISVSQFGQYTCVATNMAGTNSASAWISTLDLPVFSVLPQNTTVNQSERLTLHCQGQAAEAPSVIWYMERSGVMTLMKPRDRVSITSTGSLIIDDIQPTDEGVYTCVIVNSAGEKAASVFVNIQVPPVILSTNSPQTTVSQSGATLICQTTGDPTPTVHWINPGGVTITHSSAYFHTVDSLEIESANENTDEGAWTCKACNILGCDMASVELVIEGLPVVLSLFGTRTGDRVSLTCTVSGLPDPTVTFTSEGQPVTQSVRQSGTRHTLTVSGDSVQLSYTCQARNKHGVSSKTVTVPRQAESPTVSATGSSWVTLTWSAPVSDLPLTDYRVQMTSDLGITWQDVMTSGSDLVTLKKVNVTKLRPFAEYSFRLAALNILGVGEFSTMSRQIKTKPGAPSAPTSLVAIEMDDYIVLLTWKPPKHLNAPAGDELMYYYKVTRPVKIVYDVETVHIQGTVLANQSLVVEIPEVRYPVVYTVQVWAVNVLRNLTGEPASITIDMTSPAANTQTKGSEDEEAGLRPDIIIAIVFGSLGGLIIILIIIFIISHVRHQKKSESHSFVRPRFSLDQFYMENPKNLYADKTRYTAKRRSHGFYKFDNDESFNSIGSPLKENGHPLLDGPENVLLVAKNPLYQENEELDSSPSIYSVVRQSPEHTEIAQLSMQKEIDIPSEEIVQNCDLRSPTTEMNAITQGHDGKQVTGSSVRDQQCETGTKKDPLTPLSAKSLEEDIMMLYSSAPISMTGTTPEEERTAELEHIYSSIHSEEPASSLHGVIPQRSSSSLTSDNSSSFSLQKPPVRVMTPGQLRGPKSDSVHLNSQPGLSSDTNGTKSLVDHPETNAESQSQPVISHSPKPPLRVLSPDRLRPSSIDNSKSDIVACVKPYSYMNDDDEEEERDVIDTEYSAEMENVNKEGICHLESGVSDMPEYNENVVLKRMSAGNNERPNSFGKPESSKLVESVQTKDIKVQDNFLTDEEIKKEVVSATLY